MGGIPQEFLLISAANQRLGALVYQEPLTCTLKNEEVDVDTALELQRT